MSVFIASYEMHRNVSRTSALPESITREWNSPRRVCKDFVDQVRGIGCVQGVFYLAHADNEVDILVTLSQHPGYSDELSLVFAKRHVLARYRNLEIRFRRVPGGESLPEGYVTMYPSPARLRSRRNEHTV